MVANTTIEAAADKIVTEFEEGLVADGKASKTLESYVGDIRAFLQWLESKWSTFTGNLKRFHITSYRNYIVQEGYGVNTINKKINSIQSFNQFLIDRAYLKEQVVDLKKDKVKVAAGSEGEVEVFTDAEIEKLLFYIQSEEVLSRDRLISKASQGFAKNPWGVEFGNLVIINNKQSGGFNYANQKERKVSQCKLSHYCKR